MYRLPMNYVAVIPLEWLKGRMYRKTQARARSGKHAGSQGDGLVSTWLWHLAAAAENLVRGCGILPQQQGIWYVAVASCRSRESGVSALACSEFDTPYAVLSATLC